MVYKVIFGENKLQISSNESFGIWVLEFVMRYLSIILLLFPFSLLAQDSLRLQVICVDKNDGFLKKNITYNTNHQSPTTIIPQLNQILLQLHGKGYLAASVDSLSTKNSLYTAHLYVGDVYEWASLQNGNIPDVFLNKIGFKERFYSDKPFHYREIKNIQEKLLAYAENNGFPFAQIWLDSIYINENKIAAHLYMKRNQAIVFEAINVETETKISEKYLSGYLGIKPGDLYEEGKVKKISSRIRELAFLEEERPPNITFVKDKATVNLFLKNKKANRFDFLIGFLPNNSETGGLLLTGNAEIDLKNPFGTGKEIRLEWEQLRAGTQRLQSEFLYPYFLGLPFGFEVDFDLYKRDSSYLDLVRDIGVQYHFEGGNYLKAFWNVTATNLLEINENQVIATRRLPTNIDISNSTYGLEYRYEKLDYRFNPRKGYDLTIRAGAGTKRIDPSQKIADLSDPNDLTFDYASLYDTLQLKSFQYSLNINIARYWQLNKRSTIKTGVQSGWRISQNDLYQNELFRIGGNRLLRGFDEEAVFASLYTVFTTEYRFLIGQNSYLYAFGDYAYIENKSVENSIRDQPFGFGAGMTFETRAGVFGISYALGRQLGNPIDFQTGKIHLGYVSLF